MNSCAIEFVELLSKIENVDDYAGVIMAYETDKFEAKKYSKLIDDIIDIVLNYIENELGSRICYKYTTTFALYIAYYVQSHKFKDCIDKDLIKRLCKYLKLRKNAVVPVNIKEMLKSAIIENLDESIKEKMIELNESSYNFMNKRFMQLYIEANK